MSLGSSEGVLWTSFNSSLGNTLLSYNSLNFIIRATWCDFRLGPLVIGVELAHGVLELAWQHHDGVPFTLAPAIPLRLRQIHLRKVHLVCLVYNIILRLALVKDVGLGS